MNKLFNDAISFAVEKHKNQKRKATEWPYVVHLYDVVQILEENNASIETIIVGVLHDTVEDTNTTIEEIAEKFGVNIAAMVDVLTEKKGLPYPERKKLQAERVKNASIQVKMVKCADCLSNLKSIKNELVINPDVWSRFNAPKEKIQEKYVCMLESLKDVEAFEVYKQLKNEIEKVFANNLIQKTKERYCNNCKFMQRLPDPDPDDWFCYDDEKFICGITDKVLSVANRPYEKQLTPSDCPLLKL